MADKSTVRPGIGIGDLKFGASIADAEAYFGSADEREQSDLGKDTTICLTWDDDVTCWFSSDDDYRLGLIQVEHPHALLADHKQIAHHRDEILPLLSPAFGQPVLEDMSVIESPNYWLATYDEFSLNLWFENGCLSSIQWGYLFDESGDNAVWPL